MSKEKEGKEKSNKTAPAMSLKEKRIAKAAKRDEKKKAGSLQFVIDSAYNIEVLIIMVIQINTSIF